MLADISLLDSSEGGLGQPLLLPTPSLVSRLVDGERSGAGTVGLIEATDVRQLDPGASLRAPVVFPDAPPEEEFSEREFELWQGRVVGRAHIVEVQLDKPPHST